MTPAVKTALARIETLGQLSDDPDKLVRTFLSPANRQAAGQMVAWMRDLGMETCHTEDGSVRGILPGTNPDAPPLLLGSHLDTVIDAGKYDGSLGLISALAALETLAAEGTNLPFPIHLLGFSDEEGVRFQSTYLGSRSMIGPLDTTTLARTDGEGRALDLVLAKEGWHHEAAVINYPPGTTRGYVELHIEQGRVLEEADEPACIVSGIAGQSRLLVTITGRADHAGATPMDLRRDALTGAAECILAVESLARSNHDLVATVGKLEVLPGASNSIPQSATFTIDLRHPDDTLRKTSLANLRESCLTRTAARDLDVRWQLVQENDGVPCDPSLTTRLLNALEATTGHRRLLASGAGHDGVVMSQVTPIGMIFIRCRDGLSHHPDEFATSHDIAVGIEVLTRFLKTLS